MLVHDNYRHFNDKLRHLIIALVLIKLPSDIVQCQGGSQSALRAQGFCTSRPNTCSSEDYGTHLPCHGIVEKCKCTKGFLPTETRPTVPPDKPLNYPNAPINFTVTKYRILSTGCKVPAINITWRALAGASLYVLKGFLLHVYGGQNSKVNITRSFVITMDPDSLAKAQFFYPCIVLDYLNGGQYNIHLYSLPTASLPHINYVSSSFNLPRPDPENCTNTFGWIPDSSVTSGVGSVQVSFEAAPTSYNFTQYEVTLIHSSPRAFAQRVQLNSTDNGNIVQLFTNVAPGPYVVWIQAVVTFPCMCHVNFDCKESCTRTELTITAPGNGTLSTPAALHSLSTNPSVGPGVGQIAGITVGVIVAFIVVIVLIFLLLFKAIGPGFPHPKYPCYCKKKTTPASMDEPSSSGQLVVAESAEPSRVLLISGASNSVHHDVVDHFAAFLQDELDCTVVMAMSEFRQLSCLTRLQQLTAYDWVKCQADLASYVVVVHSNEDDQRAVQVMRSLNDDRYAYATPPPNDLFFAAIQLSAEDHIEHDKLLHIYFPYTEMEFFEKARFGITFLIPEGIDKMASHLRGQKWPPFRQSEHRPVVVPDGLRAAVDKARIVLAGGEFIPPDDETTTMLSGSIMAQLNELARQDDFLDSGCELNTPQSSV